MRLYRHVVRSRIVVIISFAASRLCTSQALFARLLGRDAAMHVCSAGDLSCRGLLHPPGTLSLTIRQYTLSIDASAHARRPASSPDATVHHPGIALHTTPRTTRLAASSHPLGGLIQRKAVRRQGRRGLATLLLEAVRCRIAFSARKNSCDAQPLTSFTQDACWLTKRDRDTQQPWCCSCTSQYFGVRKRFMSIEHALPFHAAPHATSHRGGEPTSPQTIDWHLRRRRRGGGGGTAACSCSIFKMACCVGD